MAAFQKVLVLKWTPSLTCDDANKNRKAKPKPKTGLVEREYARGLRAVAQHVGELVEAFPPLELDAAVELSGLLAAYAQALKPWARRHAMMMLNQVNGKDISAWRQLAQDLSTQLRFDVLHTPIGALLERRLQEQTELITSLPKKAAERIQRLTQEALYDSTRASEIAKEILASGEVTKSRATLIARTEVAKTASNLTEARAREAGSEGYIWRTAGDGDVRSGHAHMEGKFCRWDSPPAVMENGRIMHFHAGCIWNCRCYPEVVI